MTLLWRKVLECSSSLLTSSSLCPHSYGGSFWSVLPHTAHFVIPVISLLWRKFLECSSSLLTSSSLCPHSYGGRFWSVLPHPAHFVIPVSSLTPMEEGSGVFFLTAHFVIPVISLTSSSLCSHTHDLSSHPSHRYP